MQSKNKCDDHASQEKSTSETEIKIAPSNQNCEKGRYTNETISQTKTEHNKPWGFWFELILVIATCTSATVAYFQWQAMKSQSEIMKGQLDTMYAQTKAAFQQVSAAKSSIKIADKTLKDTQESGKEQSERAEKSLNATIENFRLDQRAWITTKEMAFRGYTAGGNKVLIKEGQPLKFKITYTNTGKTPAKILANKTYMYVMESGVKPPLLEKAIIATEKDPFTLFPNGSFSSDIVTEAYSAKQVEALKNGQYVLYVYGMIPYEDVFGQIRWTQYCNYLRPDFNSFSVCSFYNETDKTRKYK